jgi:hypothetical protein
MVNMISQLHINIFFGKVYSVAYGNGSKCKHSLKFKFSSYLGFFLTFELQKLLKIQHLPYLMMALLQNNVNSTSEHYFATCMSNFWVIKYERKLLFNWMVDLQMWTHYSTDYSFQNLCFVFYLNFQWQESLRIQYLPHPKSKT